MIIQSFIIRKISLGLRDSPPVVLLTIDGAGNLLRRLQLWIVADDLQARQAGSPVLAAEPECDFVNSDRILLSPDHLERQFQATQGSGPLITHAYTLWHIARNLVQGSASIVI